MPTPKRKRFELRQRQKRREKRQKKRLDISNEQADLTFRSIAIKKLAEKLVKNSKPPSSQEITAMQNELEIIGRDANQFFVHTLKHEARLGKAEMTVTRHEVQNLLGSMQARLYSLDSRFGTSLAKFAIEARNK